MSTLILATKLYIPPLRPQLIPRPQLIARLDAGLHANHKLILISAPPGFGKTTLLSEWLWQKAGESMDGKAGEQDRSPVAAWVSLDEYDNDSVRFWSYIFTALDRVQPGVGQDALTLLHAPQAPPIETILITLMNAIVTIPRKIVLILDDYHLIKAEPVHQALIFLLEHLPPQLHLIMTSRFDPPLALTRLRARGQLTELRENDLRFSLDEAVTLLNQVMRLNLSPGDVIALERRTEGWAAGLQLAALSIQRSADTTDFVQAFTGSHRYVLDYLADEVLACQPEHIQTFLLHTSVLERLCGPLCQAVLERQEINSQEILEYLEHANLFLIPLDNQQRWYRYHHLFADFLRAHLRQKIGPDEIAGLYLRAARWCVDSGFTSEGINYALAAGELEHAADLIEQVIIARLSEGEAITVIDWLEAMPETLVRARPRLSLGWAWALVITGQWDRVESLVRDAERLLSAQASNGGDGDNPAARSMWGEVAAIRAMIMMTQGRAVEAIALCRQALEHLPGDNLIVRSIITRTLGNAYELAGDLEYAYHALHEAKSLAKAGDNFIITLSSTGNLAELEQERGRLPEAIALFRQGLQLLESKTGSHGRPSPLAKWTYLGLADLFREQNELEMAKQYLTVGLELEAQIILGTAVSIGRLILARILQAEGDEIGAGEAIRQAIDSVPPSLELFSWASAVQARLWLAQGNLADAVRWAESSGLPLDDGFNFARFPGEYAILVRVYLAQARVNEALALLQRMQSAAEAAGRTGRLVEILMLQALALFAGGKAGQALAPLAEGLALGQPGGYVRLFVDEGAPMVALLNLLKTRNLSPNEAYIDRLLAAFSPAVRDEGEKILSLTTATSHLIEPLSDRELEILRLTAAGLSNQEIAGQLIIAEGTVKKHLHNIFGKLSVRSRTQAILRAGELNLL